MKRTAKPHPPTRLTAAGRCFHLVDIENLAGGPHASVYGATAHLYRGVTRCGLNDLVVVGCDKSGTLAAADAFPGRQVVVGTGPNGADRALLGAIDQRVLHDRFDTLVIGSGDHAFAFVAASARAAGLTTVAVVGEGQLSRALARSVDAIVHLRDFQEPAVAAAAEAA